MGWGGFVPTSTRTPTRESRITAPSASAKETLPPASPGPGPPGTPSAWRSVQLRDVHVGSVAHLVVVADGDERQVAVQIAVMQAVAEDEAVLEHDATVTNRLGHD